MCAGRKPEAVIPEHRWRAKVVWGSLLVSIAACEKPVPKLAWLLQIVVYCFVVVLPPKMVWNLVEPDPAGHDMEAGDCGSVRCPGSVFAAT